CVRPQRAGGRGSVEVSAQQLFPLGARGRGVRQLRRRRLPVGGFQSLQECRYRRQGHRRRFRGALCGDLLTGADDVPAVTRTKALAAKESPVDAPGPAPFSGPAPLDSPTSAPAAPPVVAAAAVAAVVAVAAAAAAVAAAAVAAAAVAAAAVAAAAVAAAAVAAAAVAAAAVAAAAVAAAMAAVSARSQYPSRPRW